MSDSGSQLAVVEVTDGWRVEGEIDLHTAPKLAKSLEALPEGSQLVADFSKVSFMDSSGLRVLVEAATRASAAGRSLVISNPTAAIRRVVEISGLADTLLLSE